MILGIRDPKPRPNRSFDWCYHAGIMLRPTDWYRSRFVWQVGHHGHDRSFACIDRYCHNRTWNFSITAFCITVFVQVDKMLRYNGPLWKRMHEPIKFGHQL